VSFGSFIASIPNGTFVRAHYQCIHGWDSTGSIVQIDNVPELDGVPNPTESGTRLWLVACGTRTSPPTSFFNMEAEEACSTSDDTYEYFNVERLTVSAPGFRVTAEPEAVVPFSIPSGDYAGGYELHNINVSSFGPRDSYHPGSTLDFTITRAD
jgi:hypothetical protein